MTERPASLSKEQLNECAAGLMFGEGNAFVGLASFFPNNGGADADLPPYVFLFFQLVFAATACTIVSGAIAERGRLLTFFLFRNQLIEVFDIDCDPEVGADFLQQVGKIGKFEPGVGRAIQQYNVVKMPCMVPSASG